MNADVGADDPKRPVIGENPTPEQRRPTGSTMEAKDTVGVDSVALQGRFQAARERRLGEVPSATRSRYVSAWAGRSRKAAIRMHCLECVGWNAAEVRRCTSPTCALYAYRLGG